MYPQLKCTISPKTTRSSTRIICPVQWKPFIVAFFNRAKASIDCCFLSSALVKVPAFGLSLLCMTISVATSLVFGFGAGVGPLNDWNCLGVTGCGIGPKPFMRGGGLLKTRRFRLLTCVRGDPVTVACCLRTRCATRALGLGAPYIAVRMTLLIQPGDLRITRPPRRSLTLQFCMLFFVCRYPGGVRLPFGQN